MLTSRHFLKACLFALATLAGCGGQATVSDRPARAEILLSSERGMDKISLDDSGAYLTLSDRTERRRDILFTAQQLSGAADWQTLSGFTASAMVPENRYFQFIGSKPAQKRQFAAVEGSLLRSDDGGRNFKYVIRARQDDGRRAIHVASFLSPQNKSHVIVAAGTDKATGSPYLGWSWNGGDTWIDLSSLLPGYKGGNPATVTSMTEDPQGRILLTVNEDEQAKGRLVAVTLGLLY